MAIRQYANTATPQPLTGGVTDTTVTLPVASTAGYPPTPFLLVLERGTANAEAMLCTAKTANSFTVTRGFDGTPAVAHAVGAVVEHTSAAIDFREANDHVNSAHLSPDTVNAAGDLLVGTGDNLIDRIAVGTTQNMALLAHPANPNKLAWKDIGLGAWTEWTPGWFSQGTQPNIGNGGKVGRYIRQGQTIHFQMYLYFQSTTYGGTGVWYFGYPPGLPPREGNFVQFGQVGINKTDVAMVGYSILYAGGLHPLCPDNSPSSEGAMTWMHTTHPSNWVTGDALRMWGSYETSAAVI